MRIPRRALFDVRMQLMAEDGDDRSQAEVGLDDDTDLEQNVYEGGYKSWEGASDLGQLLLDMDFVEEYGGSRSATRIVELGCGTALPSLVLLRNMLEKASSSDQKNHDRYQSMQFALADYNASVLRLITLPNVILAWAMTYFVEAFEKPSSELGNNSFPEDEGDMELSEELKASFMSWAQDDDRLMLISGPWSSPQLLQQLKPYSSSHADSMKIDKTLVLAAETIYSPGSLASFTGLTLDLLHGSEHSRALVAAKRIYFGVGGSVDAFKSMIIINGGTFTEILDTGIYGCGSSDGVGRCLLQVRSKS